MNCEFINYSCEDFFSHCVFDDSSIFQQETTSSDLHLLDHQKDDACFDEKNNKFKCITSPIFYVNAEPHIGHAYTMIVCDVVARYWRSRNYTVMMCTGTDEHGQKVQKAAEKNQVHPLEYVDKISQKFRELCELLNVGDHIFIRTTEPRHIIAATHLWSELHKNGHIYVGEYSGWYSERDETFFAESDLVDGKAPTGAEVQFIKEECYFLRLSSFQEKLLSFLEKNPDFIKPSVRYNEVVSFVKSGLKDLAISRSRISWGIPVPNDPKHVMYVWIDALCNYITCFGYPDLKNIQNFAMTDHIMGKDIVMFHAVYWPIMLMGAGLPLPKRVVAHGWWKNNNEKMSKSIGNVVSPHYLVDTYGLDQVRFYLLRDISFGEDGNFSDELIINRINSDLVNNFGNLVNRVLSFCKNQQISEVNFEENWLFNQDEVELMNFDYNKLDKYIEDYAFHRYLDEIMQKSRSANQFIDKVKPWELSKKDSIEMRRVLYILLNCIDNIKLSLNAFMPTMSENLTKQIHKNGKNFVLGEVFHLFNKIDV